MRGLASTTLRLQYTLIYKIWEFEFDVFPRLQTLPCNAPSRAELPLRLTEIVKLSEILMAQKTAPETKGTRQLHATHDTHHVSHADICD
jgi:hypothetical protein